MNDLIIQLKKVNYRYNDLRVLEDIDLEVEKKEFLGIIGPNGSGKTTLLKIILGLIPPENGEVFLFQKPISKFKDWQKIGYVPQKATQFDKNFPITVEEVVSLGCLHTVDHKKIENALSIVEMGKFRKRRISDLSGGQQQRVFIAKALCSSPELLVLDEPTVGIDSNSQEKFYDILSHLNKDHSITILLVSHDIDVVVNEVGKLVCINKKLVYEGQPKEFIKKDYLEKLYGKGRKFIIHGH
ncbi:metal ABC transporter ATP-binding protein [Candidatus Woesebacteria bacterium]|nr:metal ABC transporter ATP-binding protein [Candidatus Woesebacteria bacterium]QQG47898.1 MAG: metal ABC transporter ATP-binding protein [Candidatus Woesebacteria bacterium]